MGKFSLYNIPLKNLTEGVHVFEYILDNQYFKLIGDADSDIQKGNVIVNLSVKKVSTTFEFNFDLKGFVVVPCNRCLDDMNIDIDTTKRLIVKFGSVYSEESDEIVVIPEQEGEINIAWFLYEFIALEVPIKHVHPPGKCNKAMTAKYNKYKAVSSDDDDDLDTDDASSDDDSAPTDPRWNDLKGLVSDEE